MIKQDFYWELCEARRVIRRDWLALIVMLAFAVAILVSGHLSQ